MSVPSIRIRVANDGAVTDRAEYVLYWMIAHRRLRYSPSLDRALEWCRELDRPLLIFEPLRATYPYACDRLHRFVIDGMRDHAEDCEAAGVSYLPYLEREPGEGHGLLAALAERAAVVVTDDFPCFFLPHTVQAAGQRLPVRLEAVDGNGLIPIRRPAREFPTARGFRRFVHETITTELARAPVVDPLRGDRPAGRARVSPAVSRRWRFADASTLADPGSFLARLPIDHQVRAVQERGGARRGRARWHAFLERALDRYAEDANHPDAVSGLSPWLHFGHLAAHELFFDLADHEGWRLGDQAPRPTGANAKAGGGCAPAQKRSSNS